jgi:UDP-N-acetylmuramoyl-L-alanyl-D-glutamate--2,6-diaminopimelate ligase
MKPTLRELLSDPAMTAAYTAPENTPWETPVADLFYDSRNAAPGSAFFCLVGKTADGHRYGGAAYANGCRLFFVERLVELPADACQILVPDTRAAMAHCAAAYYGHPEAQMRLVGLTGTKGKTTTALLIRRMLEGAGIRTGYVGTNGVDYENRHFHTVNSTPESVEIYRHLRDMLDAGVTACVLEVSSQALWMGRTRGLIFDTVLFLNLSRDHIGGVEHPDFDHYRDSKKRLLTEYPTKALVVNRDDGHTAYMTDGVSTPVLDFGLGAEADKPRWLAEDIHPARRGDRLGVTFAVRRAGKSLGEDWFLSLPGDFNVQNALAALAVVCDRFGVEPRLAQELLSEATVKGRFECVTSPDLPGVTFIIDYAHNGVSLASILDALAVYEPRRLICLFGSVGGRTTERRRDLAEAAGHRCDLCILTSDNPACEPPEDVIEEIDRSFPAGSCPRVKIIDRAEAIRYAVEQAEPGDVILLAGKGHEDYQLIGTGREPFSEMEILQKALRQRAALLPI